MNEENPINNKIEISAQVEALLFVSSGPVSSTQLANSLNITVNQVEHALKQLEAAYESSSYPRGLRLQRLHGRFQLTTAPEIGSLIESFLGLESTTKLSRAALEALAIIAYKEPVTRPQVDSIRGVNSEGVIRSLLTKGLVQEIGRADTPGRPILYSVTTEFLQHFGLNSLEDLPPLESAPSDNPSGKK
jgi:segregation and condensation protein B